MNESSSNIRTETDGKKGEDEVVATHEALGVVVVVKCHYLLYHSNCN
jgi:hypothetical protein